MTLATTVVARVANSVAVPRKYGRAALRGLQAAVGHFPGISTSHDSAYALDEALRYAAAFQERSSRRWAKAGFSEASPMRAINANNINRSESARAEELRGVNVTSSGAVRTLQHLIAVDSGCDMTSAEEGKVVPLERRLTSPTFAERQQAKAHATLQQWVVYCAFRVTRLEFMARQSMVSKVLLLSPSRVVSSSGRNPEGASCLETSLRRRGAEAYIDLLVHHRLALQEEEEWMAVCSPHSPVEENERPNEGEAASRVMSLPLGLSDASWERSLAVLSWAVSFQERRQQKQGQRCHISSVEVARVLQQYAQHFGERRQVFGVDLQPHGGDGDEHGGTVNLGAANQEAVVARLQQWWLDAREAEKKDSKLVMACRMDRTTPGWIHVEGRKVALMHSSEEAAVSGDAVFAELLLQGRWKDVLRHIHVVAAAAAIPSERHVFSEDVVMCEEDVTCVVGGGHGELRCDLRSAAPSPFSCSPSSRLISADPVATMFNSSRPMFVKSKLWAHPPSSRTGRALRFLLSAPETPAEAALLQNPPTAALRSRRGVRPKRTELAEEEESQPNARTTTTTAAAANPVGRSSSAELVELRRKLWILSQLPRHIPLSLVCFEGSGVSMLPYLQRCPAKELSPWLLLCAVVAAATAFSSSSSSSSVACQRRQQQQQQLEDIEKACCNVRLQALYTLFLPHPHYAAFQEYCADLLVQLGSVLAPPEVTRVAVRSLLRPPSLHHFYDVIPGRRVPVEVACRELLWGSLDMAAAAATIVTENEDISPFPSSSLSPTVVAALERLRSDSAALRDFITAKAASLRNYHVSTWIESCGKVETLPGLLEIIVREVNEYGPPLLSPEAAAALLTAVVIPHLAIDEGDESAAGWRDTLRKLGVVYFVVPADRVFGAKPYFRGVYHESYVITEDLQWTVGWNGAEALLAGRSLRQTTKYPTTATNTFFCVEQRQRHHQPRMTFRVPELRLRLMALDLLEAIRHFKHQEEEQEQVEGRRYGREHQTTASMCSDSAGLDGGSPEVVARHLPFGVVAVNKPAGVSTTLHASYPHLIRFLARNVPWRGSGTPVLFQHGLINRIDVGTSGLVLVADTDASLMTARHASLVDKCVEKTYRALLLYCPPPASRLDTEERWYLNPKGFITHDVFANGADYSLQRASRDAARSGRLPIAWMDCRPATTMYRVLQYFPTSKVYYVEVQLRTGRRHQIRQHFAQMWHPLVGDGRYHEHAMMLGRELGLQRPALHASRITLLPLHSGGAKEAKGSATDSIDTVAEKDAWEKTVVESPLPSDMRRALRLLQEREGVVWSSSAPP